MSEPSAPVDMNDPINSRILAVSEDQVTGFHVEPFHTIAQATQLDGAVVIQRIRAMLEAGVIRRVRQTLMAINLAPGALVAWKVPEDRLADAFDWMFHNDPFTGHVVIRSTEPGTHGSDFRLWTTLKVPAQYSMTRHADLLRQRTGAETYRLMPAVRVFALGVGHMRRRHLDIGSKTDQLADALEPNVVELSDLDWRVLIPLKRDFEPAELVESPWAARAAEADLPLETFVQVAQSLAERGVIGRFSTFLEHTKTLRDGQRVTRFNGLFHWAVPPGREIDAGREIGRFRVMTHVYWRSGAEDFGGVNIMGVAHGMEKPLVLAHKAAMDQHLADVGIPLLYTNVFWGDRSEIKPSEVSPIAYQTWCAGLGVDHETMQA